MNSVRATTIRVPPVGHRTIKICFARILVLLSICCSLGVSVPISAAATPVKSSTYVVRLKKNVSLPKFLVDEIKRGIKPTELFTNVFPGFQSPLTPSDYRRLLKDKRVEAISTVTTFSIPRNPIVRGIGNVWGLDRLDQRKLPMNNLYSPMTSGKGVTVFVIDSGVDARHGEFGGRVAPGFSAVTGGRGDSDCSGHGTHVAGTVAGTNVGVANGATIIPIQVFPCGKGGASTGTILRGIDYLIGQHRANEPAVANLSLGGSADPALDAGIRAMVADGITVVVAAGNSSLDACRISPAREPLAITVGATTQSDVKASFSNFGRCLDVFAPGAQILSSWPSGKYALLDGTSMAAPHVAGVAALILEANPLLTPSQVSSAIVAGATRDAVFAAGSGSPNRLIFSNVDAPQSPGVTLPTTTVPRGDTPTLPTTTVPRSATPTLPTTTVPIAGPSVLPPSAPIGLFGRASTSSVQLSWSAPSNNGGGAVSDYIIDYWAAGGSSWTRVQDGVSLSELAEVSSLSSNTYSFRVAAVNAAGIGSFAYTDDVRVGATIEIFSDKFMDVSGSTITTVVTGTSGFTWIYYEVRLKDPFGGRLPTSIGGQLCPEDASYPDFNRCTGSTFSKLAGNSFDATYRALFGIGSPAHIGPWKVTFDPATGSRIESPRRLTTTRPLANPQITSDSLSRSSLVLRADISSNAVYWTVNMTDSGGRLPATAGAQLCAPGSSPGIGPWCSGATMRRSGTGFSASYTGLFLISNSADRGSWYPSVFWRVGQASEYQIAGTARISIQSPRINGYLIGPGSNLSGADLQGANLAGLDLRSANLIGANLIGSNLQGSNLSSANLYGANLGSANLQDSNLSNANFIWAELNRVNMRGANISGTDFTNASYFLTILPDGSTR